MESNSGGLIILGILAFFLYLLPAMIATSRKHHQEWAIWALNILLGWTAIGWIATLVWALTAVKPPEKKQKARAAQPSKTEGMKKCPYCAEDIKVAAVVCRYCGKELDAAH